MPRKYKSDASAAIHETMQALHEVGAVGARTLRDFDEARLAPAVSLQPSEIRASRQRERVSQPVFARYLNVSKNLMSDRERGVKRPSGPALRLLTIVQKKGLRVIE